MSELTLQVERLEPCPVAVFGVTSQSPEEEAITALLDWARPQGLLDGAFRFFGYDNCQPPPSHRYTVWLTVNKDVKPSAGVAIHDFVGGQFLVTEVRGVEQISLGWKRLAEFARDQGYHFGTNPGLEEHVDILHSLPLSERRIRLMLSIED
jgi:DNA gyrase inhibitor GyrI